MSIKQRFNLAILLAVCKLSFAQYSFSGYTNSEHNASTIFLSIVEDYRKLSGVYSEQIIAKTQTDDSGFFEFKGNMLDKDNRIYRLHIDKCQEKTKNTNHFNGHCTNSETLLFIAKNTDTIQFPLTFGKQLFCKIESNNPKANAFLKIDSLKQDMRFAYSEVRSKANTKLNNKKWFKALQAYGEALNEPIAELSIYAFLSDRSSDLHNYYVEDLKINKYYDNLKTRLEKNYPNAPYTIQYTNELNADKYMLSSVNAPKHTLIWVVVLLFMLIISIVFNVLLVKRIKTQNKTTSKEDLKAKLSKQERVVLELILQDHTNKTIADNLFISVSTVKTHTNNIYKKLNTQSRTEVKLLFNS